MSWSAAAYLRRLLDTQQACGSLREWRLGQQMHPAEVPLVRPTLADGVVLPPCDKGSAILAEQINIVWEATHFEQPAARRALEPLLGSVYLKLFLCDGFWALAMSPELRRGAFRPTAVGAAASVGSRTADWRGPRVSPETLAGCLRFLGRSNDAETSCNNAADMTVDADMVSRLLREIALVEVDEETCRLLVHAAAAEPLPSECLFDISHISDDGMLAAGCGVQQRAEEREEAVRRASHPGGGYAAAAERNSKSSDVVTCSRTKFLELCCHPVLNDAPVNALGATELPLLMQRAARWACLLQTSTRPTNEDQIRLHNGHWISQLLASFVADVMIGIFAACFGRVTVSGAAELDIKKFIYRHITGNENPTAATRLMPSRTHSAVSNPSRTPRRAMTPRAAPPPRRLDGATTPAEGASLRRPAPPCSNTATAYSIGPTRHVTAAVGDVAPPAAFASEMDSLFPRSARQLLTCVRTTLRADINPVAPPPRNASSWKYGREGGAARRSFSLHGVSDAVQHCGVSIHSSDMKSKVSLTAAQDDTRDRVRLSVKLNADVALRRAGEAVARAHRDAGAHTINPDRLASVDHLAGHEERRARLRLATEALDRERAERHAAATATMLEIAAAANAAAVTIGDHSDDVSVAGLQAAGNRLEALRLQLVDNVNVQHIASPADFWALHHRLSLLSRQVTSRLRFARLEGVV